MMTAEGAQPDPAVIERAVETGVAAMMAEVRKYPQDRSSPVYGGSLNWGLGVEEAMRIGLRAAAAVLLSAGGGGPAEGGGG